MPAEPSWSQLKRMLEENEERFTAALRSDLGKSDIEAYVTEIGFTISEVDEALRNLGSWMKPEKAKLPLKFRPGAARIIPQPLGMVLIIAPWNYPAPAHARARSSARWPPATPSSSSRPRCRRRRLRRWPS